ncbi:MAG: hypothetical protein ACLSB9_37795 [Hydrogeniiclostridium mannosilyticum]
MADILYIKNQVRQYYKPVTAGANSALHHEDGVGMRRPSGIKGSSLEEIIAAMDEFDFQVIKSWYTAGMENRPVRWRIW